MRRIPSHPALRAALQALVLCSLLASAAHAQCTRRPVANAGADIARCIGAVGTSDYLLTASQSASSPLNGPIVQYCWRSDVGTFVVSGASTACLSTDEITLRVPNLRGRTTVTVTLTVTDAAGCSDDDTVVLDLATAPVITRAEAGAADLCKGDAIDLFASAVNTFDVSGLVTYRWDLDASIDSDRNGIGNDDPDAVLTGVSGHITAATLTPPRTGRYTAHLTVSVSGDPCVAEADVPYLVRERPVVRLVVGPATACPGESSRFQAELAFGDAGSDLTWDFDVARDADGDGDPANDVEASGSQASHAWAEAGTVTLRVTAVGTNGCQGSETRDVLIRRAPAAAFVTEGPSCGALAMTFRDRSEGTQPLTVSWTFGDGTAIESGSVLTHIFPAPGRYAISHTVTSGDGCITAETRELDVRPVALRIAGVTVYDGQPGTGSLGNGNGLPDPGERLRIAVDVANGGSELDGAEVTLRSGETSGLLDVTDASADLPVIPGGETGTTLAPHLEAAVDAVTPCGTVLPLVLTAGPPGDAACSITRTILLTVGAPTLALSGAEASVASAPGRSVQPSMAWGAGAHGLVYDDMNGAGARAHFARLDSSGQRIGEDLVVDDVPGSVLDPHVSFGSERDEWAVAWVEIETSTATPGRFAARWRRIDASGRPVGVSRRLDMQGYSSGIDVAWAKDHWVAAWTDREALASSSRLYAQVMTADGILLGTPAVLGSSGIGGGPAGGPGGGVVRARGNGSRTLVAQIVDGELKLFALDGLSAAPVFATTLQGASGIPAMSAFGSGFLVTFENGAGGIDMAVVAPSLAVTRTTVAAGSSPAVVGDADLPLVLWQSGGDVLARTLATNGAPAGAALVVTPGPNAASQPAVSAAPGGLALATWASAGAGGASLLRAVAVGPGAASTCVRGTLGDVAPAPGGDGVVDVADVVKVLRMAVGLEPVTPEALARGDVAPGERLGSEHRITGDGVLDVADAVVLLQAATGLIRLEP